MHEAVFENGFADHRGAFGHRHQGHELCLQIRGEAGERGGGEVNRGGARTIPVQRDAAIGIARVGAGLFQEVEQGGDAFAARADQLHRPAGDGDGDGVGAGLDAVVHDAVGRSV